MRHVKQNACGRCAAAIRFLTRCIQTGPCWGRLPASTQPTGKSRLCRCRCMKWQCAPWRLVAPHQSTTCRQASVVECYGRVLNKTKCFGQQICSEMARPKAVGPFARSTCLCRKYHCSLENLQAPTSKQARTWCSNLKTEDIARKLQLATGMVAAFAGKSCSFKWGAVKNLSGLLDLPSV